jgi:GNAT superfamily N-acetyltransferase
MLSEFAAARNQVERALVIFVPLHCGSPHERGKWQSMTRQGPLRGRTTTSEPRRGDEFRLRPAKLGDYAFALSLYLEGAERHLSKIGQWDRPRITSKFRHGYKPAPAQIICVGDKPVGWMQVADFVGHLHLRQLHLIRDFRKQGIGTRLIKDLLQRADALGKPVTLDVMHGNPARFLYLRLGFRQTGQDTTKRQMIWRPPRGRGVAVKGPHENGTSAGARLPPPLTLNGCEGSLR